MKNTNDIIKKLNNLDFPQVELKNHNHNLKLALLARHNRFNSGYSNIINNLMSKKFAPVGATVLVAIVAVISIISLTGNPSPVSAREIAEKSFQVVANLSPEDKVNLKIKTGLDQFTLEEAKKAEDLKVLTYDEFINNYPQLDDDINIMFSSTSNKNGALENLTFLQYTKNSDSQVKQIVLAINTENDLPVFGYSESIYENGMFVAEFFGKYQPVSGKYDDLEYGYGYSVDSEKVECKTLDNGQIECDGEVEVHEISDDKTITDQIISDPLIQKVRCKILDDGKVLCDEEVSENGIEINIEDSGLIFRGVTEELQEPDDLSQD